ncbi:MAG: hypothetical protein J7578_01625 [Chitinophagaceae bacterium]|nr:hypothetical protein [Chitinophagaceae bacterium]
MDQRYILRIFSKLTSKEIVQLRQSPDISPTLVWLQVDYADQDTPLDIDYNIISIGNSQEYFSRIVPFKILKCLNYQAMDYPEIPRGHNSLCQFDFSTGIPPAIEQLPPYSNKHPYDPLVIQFYQAAL